MSIVTNFSFVKIFGLTKFDEIVKDIISKENLIIRFILNLHDYKFIINV